MSDEVSPSRRSVRRDDSPQEVKSFGEHLEDLRWVLIKCIIAVVIATGGCFYFAKDVVGILQRPFLRVAAGSAESQEALLRALRPAETFVVGVKAALLVGVLIASPFVFYQLWLFVSPGLTRSERRASLPIFGMGVVFFFVGVVFAYFTVLPICLKFFWNYTQYLGVRPEWTIGDYLSFVVLMLLSFGLAFEMPVAAALLAKLGLVSSGWLARQRKYAIFGIFVVAAILTPPDVISQLLLAGPMVGLYEISILTVRAIEPKG
ncbi:MAG: twin-arginine translocase subunit TatC [Phycisphaerae bacterium]|nr:twin-arginine translocase subunit TatC [Phycisphaerae bacterium]